MLSLPHTPQALVVRKFRAAVWPPDPMASVEWYAVDPDLQGLLGREQVGPGLCRPGDRRPQRPAASPCYRS